MPAEEGKVKKEERTGQFAQTLLVRSHQSLNERLPSLVDRRRCVEEAVVGERIGDDGPPGFQSLRVLCHLL